MAIATIPRTMNLASLLPVLLFAVPVLVACCVVLVGAIGALVGARRERADDRLLAR